MPVIPTGDTGKAYAALAGMIARCQVWQDITSLDEAAAKERVHFDINGGSTDDDEFIDSDYPFCVIDSEQGAVKRESIGGKYYRLNGTLRAGFELYVSGDCLEDMQMTVRNYCDQMSEQIIDQDGMAGTLPIRGLSDQSLGVDQANPDNSGKRFLGGFVLEIEFGIGPATA